MLHVDIRQNVQLPDERRMLALTQRGMLRATQALLRRVQANLSGGIIRSHSGHLAASPKARVEIDGREVVGIVDGIPFYGRILEGGARPHPIQPGIVVARRRAARRLRRGDAVEAVVTRARKAKRALRFQIGGHTIFAAQIQHPGVRPRLWATRSTIEAEPQIRRAFEDALSEALAQGSR